MITIDSVRRIDNLGRITIPRAVIHKLGIKEGDEFEIDVDNDGAVTLKRYDPDGVALALLRNLATEIRQSPDHPKYKKMLANLETIRDAINYKE